MRRSARRAATCSSAPSTRCATRRSCAATPAATTSTRRCSRPSSTPSRASARTCAARRARSASCSSCRARPRASRRARAGRRSCASDLDDPELNVRYGAWYLRHLRQHYAGLPDSMTLALAAYNAGMANVDEWVARHDGRASRCRSRAPFAETSALPRRASSTRGRLPAPLPRSSGSRPRRIGHVVPRRRDRWRGQWPEVGNELADGHPDFLDCRGGTLPAQRGLRADGRSAAGDRRARRPASTTGEQLPDAARRDRHGQDVHDGERDRGASRSRRS